MIKKILDKNLLVLYPDAIDLTKSHPVIVMLHGIGECANDAANTDSWLQYLITNGPQAFIKAVQQTYKGTDFIAVMPQLWRWDINDLTGNRNYTWPSRYVLKALEYAKANYKIDAQRTYLAGLSLGGGGVLNFLTESQANADMFAAAICCCPVAAPPGMCNIAKAKLPVAFYHAEDDNVVSHWGTVQNVTSLLACPDLKIQPLVKYPKYGGHGVWDTVFDPVAAPWGNTLSAYDFFLLNTRTTPANPPLADIKPIPPITEEAKTPIAEEMKVDAGGDKTSPLVTSFILDGATASGYKAIWWEAVSGPTKTWLTGDPLKPTVNSLNGLKEGVYKFKLSVQDVYGRQKDSFMTLTILSKQPPVEKKIDYYLVTAVYTDGSRDLEEKLLPQSIIIK